MGYPIIPQPFPGFDETIAQLKEQDAAFRELAGAAAGLLVRMFPGNRAEIERLRLAAIAYVCCGSERQLERLEAQQEQLKQFRPGRFSSDYSLPSPAEQLTKLVERRDELTSRIDQARAGIDQLPIEGMAGIFEASIIRPMVSELEGVEAQITQLQKMLELEAPES